MFRLVNLTGEESSFSEKLMLTHSKWTGIYNLTLEENKFISNAAMEIINNSFLSEKVCQWFIETKPPQANLEQLFSLFPNFVGRAETEEKNLKELETLPFDSDLQKIRLYINILCMLAPATQIAIKLAGHIPFSSFEKGVTLINDKEYLSSLLNSIKYLCKSFSTLPSNTPSSSESGALSSLLSPTELSTLHVLFSRVVAVSQT